MPVSVSGKFLESGFENEFRKSSPRFLLATIFVILAGGCYYFLKEAQSFLPEIQMEERFIQNASLRPPHRYFSQFTVTAAAHWPE